MWPHGSHPSTTIIESRCDTWSANTSAGEVCAAAAEGRCSSKASPVESRRRARAATSKAPDTAATAKVAAATPTSTSARTCPRWLGKTKKSDTR